MGGLRGHASLVERTARGHLWHGDGTSFVAVDGTISTRVEVLDFPPATALG